MNIHLQVPSHCIHFISHTEGCDTDWILQDGVCFKFVDVQAPYNTARKHCQDGGWKLPSIHDLGNISRILEMMHEDGTPSSVTRW